jgi:transcription initiation factor TFIIH subunit 3
MSDSSHQVIILDINPHVWHLQHEDSKSLINLREYIDIIHTFAKSHIMLNKDNSVQIIAAHPCGCAVLYPPPSGARSSGSDFDLHLHGLVEELLSTPTRSLPSEAPGGGGDPIYIRYLAQALSRSLCTINRKLQLNPTTKSKILCLQISHDAPSNYNAVMNSIFSAQKFGIPVDALIFSSADSSFLQQACLLTGGIYSKPRDQRDSLQLLLTHHLPGRASRQVLRAPLQTSVDFKAACTCHNRPVDFTFMCSVCLSLFCPATALSDDKCEICGTRIRR